MIRMDYINDTYTFESDDILRPYSKYLNSCLDDMEPVFSEYSLVCDKIDLELMMMESVSETTMIIYEDAKKSFLQSVGEKILELRDKFMEFVNNMIDKIKTFSFNHKSNEQKLQKLLKEHPEFKNDTLMAVREGALNLNNIKSFKELNDNFDEIIKMAKKGDIDPDSLKGKIEAAKEKHEKKLKKAAEVAGAASAIITAGVALATICGKISNAKKITQEFGDSERKRDQEAYNAIYAIQDEQIKKTVKTDNKTMNVYKPDDGKITPMKTKNGDDIKVISRDLNGNAKTDGNGNIMMKAKVGEKHITVTTTTTHTKKTYTYGAKNNEGKHTGTPIDNRYVSAILEMNRYRKKSYAKAIGENLSIIEKMESAVANFVDNHMISDKTKQAFHAKHRQGNIDIDKTDIHTTIDVQSNINGRQSGRTKNIDKTIDHKSS